MRRISVLFLTLLVACSSSTDVKAGDPSILVRNDLNAWVFITWRDGQGIAGRDSVAPRTAGQCVRFLAQPDSAYWEATATAANNGGPMNTATVTSPTWFNPADRPAWSLDVSFVDGYSVGMLQADAATPC